MTWKAYTAVSGATLIATYLFSAPPTIAPGRAPAPVQNAAAPPAPSLNIEEQAARLATRVREETEYHAPARNPFRFGAARVAAPIVRAPEPVVEAPPVVTVPQAPPPLPIRLTGISAATVDGQRQRTAVLITLDGVVTAREGEMVGPFRVVRVEEDAVELAGADGVTRRLALRP
jgi:hypothetical protein